MSDSVARFDLLKTPITNGVWLVEASAGTGKTYNLASLVLRLLLERRTADITRILVVTFTNAAAEELTNRIRERLRDAVRVFAGEETDDELLLSLKTAHAKRDCIPVG